VSEPEDVRRTAARLVREWAERRRIAWRDTYGNPPRVAAQMGYALSEEQFELLKRCADDIERGMP
jgi:hypothetical protein